MHVDHRPSDQVRAFYRHLQHTGLDYYFSKRDQILQSHRPVVCAACLVILEADPRQLSISQHKILDGMLKVLDLSQDDYCVAWMGEGSHQILHQAILKYAPYSALFLGSVFDAVMPPAVIPPVVIPPAVMPPTVIPAKAGIHSPIHNVPITHTYSPQELEADPTRKRAAFDALLALKQQLHILGA